MQTRLTETEIAFTGIFIQDKDGRFTGFFSEVPEAVAQGDTMDEVEKNLFNALPMALEDRKQLQEEDSLINGSDPSSFITKSYKFQSA